MHSAVRELSGIAFEGGAYPHSFVLADVRLTWDLPQDEVHLFASPAGLVVAAPLPHGRHRIVATVADAPEHPTRDDIARLLADRGPATTRAAVDEVAWSSRFRVHHRLAAAYQSGPVFLAGDAAHVHSPAGGQGMNLGIRDAVALGDLLAGALAGGEGPARLAQYTQLRRPIGRKIVAETGTMTKAATRSGLPARARNVVMHAAASLPPVRHALAMRLSGLASDPPAASHPAQTGAGSTVN